jgi:hypothetical protein
MLLLHGFELCLRHDCCHLHHFAKNALSIKIEKLCNLSVMSFSNTPHSYTPTAGMAEMLASANMREKSKQQQQQGKFSSGGFRDQTNTKLAQGSQSSFSSKTPSTAKKGAAPSKEQTEDGVVDEGDFRSGVAGADGDVKKKRTRPKIDADLLAGDNGFAAILKTFPTLKHELKGEGHEAHDVRLLISRLQVALNNSSSNTLNYD